jgi:hypothetical protein
MVNALDAQAFGHFRMHGLFADISLRSRKSLGAVQRQAAYLRLNRAHRPRPSKTLRIRLISFYARHSAVGAEALPSKRPSLVFTLLNKLTLINDTSKPKRQSSEILLTCHPRSASAPEPQASDSVGDARC